MPKCRVPLILVLAALCFSDLFLTVAVAVAAKPPYTLSGKVVALTDGDSLTIEDDAKTPHKIRLAGIDAPELAQAFGTKARDALAEKVSGKVVRVEVIDIDRYKQEVGRMYLGARFINMEMVRDGFAWRFIRFDLPGEFKAAEADARAHKRELWTDPHPLPPWQFRRQKTNH
jgi:endonuclease YncB( thermonuclease family)